MKHRFKRGLALSFVTALTTTALVAGTGTTAEAAAPTGPWFKHYHGCYPSVNITNLNEEKLVVVTKEFGKIRIPAGTAVNQLLDGATQITWRAFVRRDGDRVSAGKGVFEPKTCGDAAA